MTDRVRLHDMAYGGAAVGRPDDGAAVFVPGGLPGELVDTDIVERRRNFARARLIAVLEPAPERVAPPCPHFLEGCGGCQWQHASYEAQLAYKQAILAGQLHRLGGISDAPLGPAVPSPRPFGYRNTAEFHVRGAQVGFHREGSHQLVDIDSCPLVEEPINRALAAIRKLLPAATLAGRIESAHVRTGVDAVQVTLYCQDDPRGYRLFGGELAAAIGEECRVAGVRIGSDRTRGLHGPPHVLMGLAGQRFRVSGQSFFQVNSDQAEVLARLVLEHVPRGGRLLDLFAGVGTFGLLGSGLAGEVVGVESQPSAIADAEANRAEAGAENVRFQQADVAQSAGLAAQRWDLAVLDPPRAGCPRDVLEALQAERIVYVSCDPSTLARDLKILTARAYHLESVQLVDLFPQTYHIESVAVLSR